MREQNKPMERDLKIEKIEGGELSPAEVDDLIEDFAILLVNHWLKRHENKQSEASSESKNT